MPKRRNKKKKNESLYNIQEIMAKLSGTEVPLSILPLPILPLPNVLKLKNNSNFNSKLKPVSINSYNFFNHFF